jgi:uncharacterized membrane protein YhaH (DUF805 family)
VSAPGWFALAGRISRQQYWWRAFGVPTLVGAVAGVLAAPLAGWVDRDDSSRGWVLLALGLAWLVPVISSLCACVMRMHDLGRSGWWVLLNAVPLVNFGMLVWQGCYRGMVGANAYGPDPLQENDPTPSSWQLVGVDGEYAGCAFPLQTPLVIGTDPRHASVVIDARRHPDVEPAHCELRPPVGIESASLYWPDPAQRFVRRDPHFNGLDLDLGGGLRFTVQDAALPKATK